MNSNQMYQVNRKATGIMYLDIETVANPDMIQFVPGIEPAMPEEAPKNYKKDEAIQGWIAKENQKRTEEYEERLAKMPLDIDHALIVAMGWAIDGGEVEAHFAEDEAAEAEMLRAFWSAIQNTGRICGFNVLNFDIPVVMRRSWILGVNPSRIIDMRRYSTKSVIDLMQLLYNWGNAPGPRYRGLKVVCEMFGIQNDLPTADGSQVKDMTREEILAYQASDVAITRDLANRTFGHYWM